MSRQQKTVTSPFGRDKGKDFLITDMDAFSCEEWAREAVSAVYRCATQSDQAVLSFLSEGIRDAFTEVHVPDLELPSCGSLTAESPQYKVAQEEKRLEAESKQADARNAAPTQMAALIGIRLFLQLPYAEQSRALKPLLSCISFDLMGQTHRVHDGSGITKVARTYIEDPRTIAWLQVEAFKRHTDFFTPAIQSIYARVTAVAIAQMPEISPEQ